LTFIVLAVLWFVPQGKLKRAQKARLKCGCAINEEGKECQLRAPMKRIRLISNRQTRVRHPGIAQQYPGSMPAKNEIT
jgi:hypothetical protein